jgi:CDP-glucose 4,6-dehydratase
MSPYAPFYRGKRVLVTGHTGFLGGWLVAWLKLLGAKVCGYGLPPSSRPNFFDATLLDRGISSIFADVRDRDSLANTFADFQPEIVFHAGQSHTGHDPVEIIESYVMGTANLLEEARQTGCVRALVLLSDLHTFGKHDKSSQTFADWIRASQNAAETIGLAFAQSFLRESRTRVAIAHLHTLIGGGDWAEHGFVPALLHGITTGEPVMVRDAVFYCSHILEALNAGLRLAESLYASGPEASVSCSFCSDKNAISQAEFANQFVERWDDGSVQIEVLQASAATPLESLNKPRSKPYAGWNPSLTHSQALAWTVDWYKSYYADPRSAWRTTEAQIEEFEKLASAKASSPQTRLR